MPNIVIQQILIADYKNMFLMLINSNCSLRIINGPSDKWVIPCQINQWFASHPSDFDDIWHTWKLQIMPKKLC